MTLRETWGRWRDALVGWLLRRDWGFAEGGAVPRSEQPEGTISGRISPPAASWLVLSSADLEALAVSGIQIDEKSFRHAAEHLDKPAVIDPAREVGIWLPACRITRRTHSDARPPDDMVLIWPDDAGGGP